MRRNAARPAQTTWFQGSARFAVTLPAEVRAALDAARLREVAALWREGHVEYLGLRGDRRDWAGAGRSRLWRYERQYHVEVVALALAGDVAALEEAKELVTGWVQACPQPRGDAWEPYPVARRILSWSLAGSLSPALGALLAPGIAAQVRFLARHLEHHLLGNHLICDAAALLTGSLAVAEAPLDETALPGAALLAAELKRQVLSDGGYAERTAQYHAIVLRDVLLAIAFSRARGVRLDPRIENSARAMSAWFATVAREKSVPFLNDAAPDAAPPLDEVLSLARALHLSGGAREGQGDIQLVDTGWTLVREARHELLFEHGPIGPDEQPGHGHSDALSYELFWDGHPVVTDTGVTTYDLGAIRAFERSAAAHATVTVGGEGPDELWAAFRVGARGAVEAKPLVRTGEGVRVVQGRMRAPSGWEHERRLAFWPGEALVVFDVVRGARAIVRSHLPVAPDCNVDAAGVVRFGGGTLQLVSLRGTRDAGSDSWVGEGFGRRRPRRTYAFEADGEGRVA